MLACVNVDYRQDVAIAACMTFKAWESESPEEEFVATIASVEPYEPGQFYKRELPCILKVLEKLPTLPEILIIDGYVWLGDETKPGLGVHLFRALESRVAIVGVAKTRFRGADPVREVLRGGSKKPLLVSAIGMSLKDAADGIQKMYGEYRIPKALKLADSLSRASNSS